MSRIAHVVLTGGVGSRLWPLSRKSRPKQYLDIFSGDSLFEKTIVRNKKMVDQLIIVGNVDNIELSTKSLQKLILDGHALNIVESTPRNTAAAIAFAAFAANEDDILIVTPSDHVITDNSKYNRAVKRAIELAKSGNIVTFGITPTRPETGFGYIEFNKEDVISFREKPDISTARKFLDERRFCWNSGMFCFKSKVFLDELKKYEPVVYEQSKVVWENNNQGVLDLELSLEIPSISVDYAVMERSKQIKVVSSSFGWSDLGSFEALYDYFISQGYYTDERGNMLIGVKKETYFIGLSNCIVVDTEDSMLVLDKDYSQDVKYLYQQLEKNNSKLL